DAVAVVGDARRLEAEPLDVGRSSGADEDRVAGDLAAGAAGLVHEDLVPAAPLGTLYPRAEHDRHAVGAKPPLDDRRRVRVLLPEHLRQHLEPRHAAAEPAEGLRQLAADRARADDGEAAWQLGQPEDRLAGEVADVLEPGEGRRRRPRPGGDDGAREGEPPAVHLERPRAAEAAVAEEDVDAEPREALG